MRKAPIRCGILLAALAAIAAPAAAQDAAKPPIKLGIFLSLSGPAAAGAASNRIGNELAVKEINAAGGILGRPVKILYADDQGDPTIGVGEMRRLVFQEKIDIVVGPFSSQIDLAALPIMNEGKVASVSDTASAALTPQAGPYHFSLDPDTVSQGTGMATFAADVLHAKAPAFLYDDGAAARAAVETIKKVLAEHQITPVAEQQYKLHPNDLSPQLLSLRRAKPDLLIIYAGSPDDVGVIEKSVSELGWDVTQLASLTAAVNPGLVMKVGGKDAYSHMLAQSLTRFTYCKSQGDGDRDVIAFMAKVNAALPNAGAYPDYFNAANGYDAVYVLKAAIEATGKTDGETLAKWIEANAGSIKVIMTDKLVASPQNHFLLGTNALSMIAHADRRSPEGLTERAGCS